MTLTASPSEHSSTSGLGRIAVVGGGIAGLATAYALVRLGARVTLFESSSQLGGLGSSFEYNGTPLEKFYHCMLPTDGHLLGLLDELGIRDRVYWRHSSLGYLSHGTVFPLNTPLDLLRFRALTPVQRLRVGLTAVCGKLSKSDGLDTVPVEQWLTKTSGRHAFKKFWLPMLRAKFGDRYHDVPAMWFWTRFHREKSESREIKGYIRGGYRTIVDAIAKRLDDLGTRVVLQASIDGVDLNALEQPVIARGERRETFDRAIVTAPFVTFRDSMARGAVRQALPAYTDEHDLQGVVNTVLILSRSLSSHYWIAAVDDALPFQGIVEPSNLLTRFDCGGQSLVHLMNYVHRSEEMFAENSEALGERMVGALLRAFPNFPRAAIRDRFVFRAPFVEPLLTLGYAKKKPPVTVIKDRVFLATTSQVYPEITSWNGSLGLVASVVHSVAGSAPLYELDPPARVAV